MAYGELLNLDCRETLISKNPCVRKAGPGPEGKRCKSCAHLISITYANTYHKCELRQNTHGPATDHRVNWPACAMFKDKG
jgi:hypothetical protein